MKKKIAIISVDLILVLIGVFAHPIVYFFSSIIPECPAKAIGILCPACGGTRCFYYFFSGDFAAAFSLNAFLFLTLIYALALFLLWNLSWLFEAAFAKKLLRYLLDYRVFLLWGIGMGLFCLIRNVI